MRPSKKQAINGVAEKCEGLDGAFHCCHCVRERRNAMRAIPRAVYWKILCKICPRAFAESANPRGKLFLQDGDSRQNSAAAKRALDDVDAKLLSIPPISPHINPIENLFHLIQSKLGRDALERNITNENFERFSERVKETMENYPVDAIDKIIDSMDRRISEIIKCKGQRLKY